MSYTDCELPSFYSVHDRKAKKQHKCCECSALILPGEVYVYCIGKWDDLEVFKQHLLCANACRYVRDELSDGECIGFGTLKEWHQDYFQYMDRKGKLHPTVIPIRKMMADIFRRERGKI